jgi:hypothetical protein
MATRCPPVVLGSRNMTARAAVVMAMMASLVGPARADEWTRADTAFEVTYAVLHVADWRQTVDLVRNHPDRHETNPILGSHPSQAKVDGYFLAALGGHVLVARVLPMPYRRLWQCAWIGIEGTYVRRNHVYGFRMEW